MNIWLVSIFEQTPRDENTATRFNMLAKAIAARGHKVTFVASTFKHNTKVQRFADSTSFQETPNLEVVYLKSRAYKGNMSFARMASHYRFSSDLVRWANHQQPPDVVVAAFPPISIAGALAAWCQRESIPLVVDVIDPWPDVFKTRLSSFGPFVQWAALAPFKNRVKHAFKRVAGVASISNQYLEWARQYNPDLENLQCFYPAIQLAEVREQLRILDKKVDKKAGVLTVIYAGSLASSYDITTILGAAGILETKWNSKIRFVIAGAGPQQNVIQDYVRDHKNLAYLGRLSKADLMREYAKADVGLTQHVRGATQSVTYKLFDLLSCGLPVLNSLESEMKDIVVRNRVGLFNTPGDPAQLAANIEMLYNNPHLLAEFKTNALALTEREGDAAVVYNRFADFIESFAKEK